MSFSGWQVYYVAVWQLYDAPNELSATLDDVLGANRQTLWQFSFGMHVS
jgi:hypothetical protein